MAKTVLLTGANGFLGKNAQKLLKSAGYEVHFTSSLDIMPTEAAWHKIDLLDNNAVKEFVKNLKPNYLLHLAWDTTPGKYLINPLNLDWVSATLNLCRAFYENGGRRAVFAGTCFEYNLCDGVLSESAACIPQSLYGWCKLALSSVVSKFCEDQNLSFAWGRIFYLYGPYENDTRVIPYVINSLLSGKEALCSDAIVKRDYLYAEDVAAALIYLLEIGQNGIFNIGSGNALPLRELLCLAARLTGRPDLLKLGALHSVNEIPVIEADVSKLAYAGFLPRYSLEEGLSKTVEWWREKNA